MKENIDEELSNKYCPRFGIIAVDKSFITPNQLKKGLTKQIEDDLTDRPHRLIGRIFFEEGWMTHKQIETVLYELFKNKETAKETD